MKAITNEPETPQETPDKKPEQLSEKEPKKVNNPFVTTINHSVSQ